MHATLGVGGDAGRQQQQLGRSRGDNPRGFWGVRASGEGSGLSPRRAGLGDVAAAAALPERRRGKRRAERPLGTEKTNFGLFQGKRRLGSGCPAGGGLSHCETRLLFLGLRLPAGGSPGGSRGAAPNGFPGPGHPRPPAPPHKHGTISGSPERGAAASSSLRKGCLQPTNPSSPTSPPSG